MDPTRDFAVVPDVWRSAVPRLAGPVTLQVAGFMTPVELTEEHLERVYLPLLATLQAHAAGGRVLAGLAGVPGSGKSTLGLILQYVADAVCSPGHLVVVGMDGWHYPNAVLEQRWTIDAGGRRIPLRQRKGGPESFDVPALVEALRRLRQEAAVVRLPAYDRRLHEPVPNALEITPAARVILIEGNFLFSETPPWDRVGAALQPRLFLEADLSEARERVIARHVRGGSSPQEAVARFEGNDRFNAEAVVTSRSRADWLVCMDAAPGIRRR